MTLRRIAVAGATGLVGRCLVQQLCAEPGVAEVHGLARRPLEWTHPKLQMHRVDFAALPALPPVLKGRCPYSYVSVFDSSPRAVKAELRLKSAQNRSEHQWPVDCPFQGLNSHD